MKQDCYPFHCSVLSRSFQIKFLDLNDSFILFDALISCTMYNKFKLSFMETEVLQLMDTN